MYFQHVHPELGIRYTRKTDGLDQAVAWGWMSGGN
jgi:hypothetical protein